MTAPIRLAAVLLLLLVRVHEQFEKIMAAVLWRSIQRNYTNGTCILETPNSSLCTTCTYQDNRIQIKAVLD